MSDRRTSWLVLWCVMLFAFIVRVDQAGLLPTPHLLCDEFIYADLAKNFADEGELLFRGEPLRLSLLYPVLLAPAWLAERMATTYALAKTINVALMTASAVPLYLLGRRLLTPGWALLPPVLTLLLPMTLLSGLLTTESAFMPVFLLAVYAIAIALERPTLTRQAFALAAIVLATAVRFQGAVLVAVFVTGLLLVVIFDLRAGRPDARGRFVLERLRPYWPTAAAFAGVAVAFVALEAARGGSWAYEEVARAEYSAREAWRMTRLHLADLALTSGLVPLSALILLSCRAFTGATRGPAEHAFLAVALAAVVWLLVQGRPLHLAFLSRLVRAVRVLRHPVVVPRLGGVARATAHRDSRRRDAAGRDRGFRARDARYQLAQPRTVRVSRLRGRSRQGRRRSRLAPPSRDRCRGRGIRSSPAPGGSHSDSTRTLRLSLSRATRPAERFATRQSQPAKIERSTPIRNGYPTPSAMWTSGTCSLEIPTSSRVRGRC